MTLCVILWWSCSSPDGCVVAPRQQQILPPSHRAPPMSAGAPRSHMHQQVSYWETHSSPSPAHFSCYHTIFEGNVHLLPNISQAPCWGGNHSYWRHLLVSNHRVFLHRDESQSHTFVFCKPPHFILPFCCVTPLSIIKGNQFHLCEAIPHSGGQSWP